MDRLPYPLGDALGERRFLERALRLAQRAAQLLLPVEELLDGALSEEQRLHHGVLVDLFRAALHHEDGVARGGHDDVHIALLALQLARVGDELPADAAHAHAGEGEREGDVRHGQREGRTGQRQYVCVVLVVGREDGRDDLRLVLVALGE